MFPEKNGVSKYSSPLMIIFQENVDYENHLKMLFGTYVLANNEPKPTNTNAPRCLDCIYLRDKYITQGGHELLHLNPNPVITCNSITPTTIKPNINKQVHSIADREGIPSGIKISNRTGLVLYNSAWITGVDYSEGDDNENEFENESGNEEDNDTELSDVLTEDE